MRACRAAGARMDRYVRAQWATHRSERANTPHARRGLFCPGGRVKCPRCARDEATARGLVATRCRRLLRTRAEALGGDVVLADQLEERSAVLLCGLRGMRDIAVVCRQQ